LSAGWEGGRERRSASQETCPCKNAKSLPRKGVKLETAAPRGPHGNTRQQRRERDVEAKSPGLLRKTGVFALTVPVRAVVRNMNTYERRVKAIEKNSAEKELSEKEKKLIELIRSTGYGEIRITVQDGQPIQVEEVKKSIKL